MLLKKILKQQITNNWLVNYDNKHFLDKVTALTEELVIIKEKMPQASILLAESNPYDFLAVFLASLIHDCPIFLANSDWQSQEWEVVDRLVQPNLIWDSQAKTCRVNSHLRHNYLGKIMIPTGGTSGKIRFAMHTWQTLSAAVTGFRDFFGKSQINSCCLLPLYHVGGLMQCLRSFLTGGKLSLVSYKLLKENTHNTPDYSQFFISLVPTQLQFFLDNHPGWLSQFQTILVGGAPIWPSLLNQSRSHRLPLALAYGMTETAAQVITLQPEEFLAGKNCNGRVLPHARVKVCDEDGDILDPDTLGVIYIQADSLCLGYYPDRFPQSDFWFSTHDLGLIDSQGYLTVCGRRNHSIITGGETVFPQEVEAAILATGLVEDVCVLGLEDNYWGEVVVAVYVSPTVTDNYKMIADRIVNQLSKYKCPKYWYPIDSLPRNPQGKINYQLLKDWVICHKK